MKGWRTNDTGKMPHGYKGKRVFVRLRTGVEPPDSWPADMGTDWSLSNSPFDITHWKPA